MLGSHASSEFRRSSRHCEIGFATQFFFDSSIMPANAVSPTCTDRLEGGFLGSEPCRIVLVLVSAFFTITNFCRCKGPISQALASPDHRQAELFDLDYVYANSYNHFMISR